MTNIIQFPAPSQKTVLEEQGEAAIHTFASLAEVPGRELSAVLFAVSQIVVQFLDNSLKEHGQVLVVTYTADFLPLLLDASAFTHYHEHQPSDES